MIWDLLEDLDEVGACDELSSWEIIISTAQPTVIQMSKNVNVVSGIYNLMDWVLSEISSEN